MTRRALLTLPWLALGTGHTHAERTVLVTGHPGFAPFSFQQGEQVDGILPEVARRLLRSLSLQPQLRALGPWARVQQAARQGQVDLLAGLYDSPERREYLDFLNPAVMGNDVVVVVRRGRAFPYRRWEDLVGRRLGRVHGDRYNEEFERFLEQRRDQIEVDAALNPELNFRKLLLGRIDAIVYSRWVSERLSRQLGLHQELEFLPIPVFTGQLHLAIARSSGSLLELKPRLETQLQELLRDGQLLPQLIRHYTATP
ncbi:substrate-binding periplasmic protein [Roseateles sp.]|jgi:polar amino acid transport system substrate-binding protein|uniref:substrate-binding periplasmic protein n=1 Tax=Roseateles sp. TaxID=1971397 RepID=UPI00391ADA0A